MNLQAEGKPVIRSALKKNNDSIVSNNTKCDVRNNHRTPLADINGNQKTSQHKANEKFTKNNQQDNELQNLRTLTANKQKKSKHGRRNSSCGNSTDTISSRKLSKKQRKKKERELREANKKTGTEVVLYNAMFAQKQKVIHTGLCCVCHKEQLSMRSCRCQFKYCSRQCLLKHTKDEVQKEMCVRSYNSFVAFTNARSRLTRDIIDRFRSSGITEISSYLYSIPRREIYEMMNGPIKAVILQILLVKEDLLHLNVYVQDITGQRTVLRIQCGFGVSKMGNKPVFIGAFKESIKRGEFLLLVDGHWNNHRDRDSAAIDITDLQQIMPFKLIKLYEKAFKDLQLKMN